MRVVIVYPLPFDAWPTFEPHVAKFTETFKQFPPGYDDYEVVACECMGRSTDRVVEMFWGIKTRFVPYSQPGCDIGAAQYCAFLHGEDELILAMTSRCFFHRAGWLQRYVEAHELNGPGLYGASTSWESGKMHVCTRAYMLDAVLWREYPFTVDSRAAGQRFEVGDRCVTDWARAIDVPTMQVRWDGQDFIRESRRPQLGGIFRRGAQNEMLVWDKHTEVYAKADAEEKLRLEKMADPP